jgi:hypothetical protein
MPVDNREMDFGCVDVSGAIAARSTLDLDKNKSSDLCSSISHFEMKSLSGFGLPSGGGCGAHHMYRYKLSGGDDEVEGME